ncbi:hypothetical protein [uncultured Microbacterium sp.]|uniref:hypothetical protein n=1 Tax=uncultured Microbacterium sp. TaxID=191216 RepID=UPI00260C15AD|nr:hypothetical protein [uncultured Microbacterium sp.]
MSSPAHSQSRQRLMHIIGFIAIIAVCIVVIWLDIATGLWQQAVILSGIAAGVLTFLLTSLFIERWMNAAAHKRWLPVTRLALIDMLHALADEEHSHIARGRIVTRTIDVSGGPEGVLHSIHAERRAISHALARWTGFLAASADVQPLMDHVAELALLLDAAQDAVLAADEHPTDAGATARMHAAVSAVDTSIAAAAGEIQEALSRMRSTT